MPGGKIAPDGRPSQAPGVGKDAKRHDLEGTPGLHNSSLQQGDVAMLEEGQRQFKQVQKAATPAPSGGAAAEPRAVDPRADAPDAIEFIAGRAKGTFDPTTAGRATQRLDVERWKPLMSAIASDPTSSGPLTAGLLAQLVNMQNLPREGNVEVVDRNAADDAIWASIGR